MPNRLALKFIVWSMVLAMTLVLVAACSSDGDDEDTNVGAAAAATQAPSSPAATSVAAGAEGACLAADGAPTLVPSSSPSLEQAATNTNVMARTIDQTTNCNASRFGMSSSPLFRSMSAFVNYSEKAA